MREYQGIPCFCCGADLLCGCKSCADRNAGKDLFLMFGNNSKCSVCGYTAEHDEWMDMEWEFYMRNDT